MATITEIQLQDGSVHQLAGGGGGSNTYTLSKSGNTITLSGSGGDTSSVTDSDTTYTFSLSGNVLTITPSSGSPQTITLPDDDTTYSISINGNVITLTGSDGSISDVTLPSQIFIADQSTTLYEIENAVNSGEAAYFQYWENVSTMVLLPLAELESSDHASFTGVNSDGDTVIVFTVDSNDVWTPFIVPIEDTTYTISLSGNTLTLTPSVGTPQSVTIPDDDTTYTISKSGDTLTLTGSDGSTSSVTISGGTNTTYDLTISGHTITLDGSDGSSDSVTVPDDNTTYSLSISGNTVTLTGSDGSTSPVTIPDDNTTYTLGISGDTITLTGSDGSTSPVTLPKDQIVLYDTYTIPSHIYPPTGQTGSTYWLYGANLNVPTHSGYTPVGIVGVSPSAQSMLICAPLLSYPDYGTRLAGYIRNASSSQLTDSIKLAILYVKNEYLSI